MNRAMDSLAPVKPAPAPPAARRWLTRGVVPLLVLAVGATVAYQLMHSAPRAHRQPAPPPAARLVQTVAAEQGTYPTRVAVMGTVVAARRTTVSPRVQGPVIEVSPQLKPGGLFQVGEQILRIDDSDYRLAVRRQQSSVAEARAALQQERGQQAIARREYQMLGKKLAPADRALVLREPQQAAAEAVLDAARASLAAAELDLAHTRVVAPFAGTVVERDVDLGTRVAVGTPLLTLVGTDDFWLEASVPMPQLRWIVVPETPAQAGSTVRIRNDAAWPAGSYRAGQVIGLAPDVDSAARMAQVLIRVPDPLALTPQHASQPKILINDFLSVEIEGRTLAEAIRLDRELVHGGDQVWVLDDDNRLAIRTVHVVFRGARTVLIDAGLAAGEQVITTDLAAPVAGMALRTADTPTADVAPDTETRP